MEKTREKQLNKQQEQLINRIYYDEGYTLGRNNLFNKLKTYKNHPSERQVGRWLKEQKLNQLYESTRVSSGSVQSFKPSKPFFNLSADLIDFTNKPAKQFRYILIVIDNFSRYLFAEPITAKTADKVASAMTKILKRIKTQFRKEVKYILSDDGSEFKGAYIQLLDKNNIVKRRTLGGQPQSNGMVERANGKLKIIMAKNKKINGGSWLDNLAKSVNVYNDSFNRTIGMTPTQASVLKRTEYSELKENVQETLKEEKRERKPDYNEGDKVRLKITKGKLDKSSTPNWSETVYKIRKVIKGRGSIASKYLITNKDDDQRFGRNDLQIIEGKIKDIPEKKKVRTRATTKKQTAPRRSSRKR